MASRQAIAAPCNRSGSRRGADLAADVATLLWVVAGLTARVLPHVPHVRLLGRWLLGASVAALRIAAFAWPSAAEVAAQVLAFAALFAVLLHYRTINGIEAGTALLVVMAGMKLLESERHRDRHV